MGHETNDHPEPDEHDVPTLREPTSKSLHRPLDDSRFAPGTVIGDRYRIVGRIGRGGMGEVYRADDLKLGQAVALKFLPRAYSEDAASLRHFHDEVRIARDIGHPNVCRTYDISQTNGDHFISMEYVDGEDLASLLRRIGRLPADKAVQIARQLCAGLAAAHEKGVLHRDLKPANIMIDGRGAVRITDFGLAALADDLEGKSIRSGTPAYMAPEQLAGTEVTVRSDIYALGLILYEVFTGRPVVTGETIAEIQRHHDSGTFATLSSVIGDVDPAVEAVIERCLSKDPRGRPGSAIAVSAALPGGDPLAAALAAGETPSPEMVAEAGIAGGLHPGLGAAFAAVVVVGVIAIAVLSNWTTLLKNVAPPEPPAVLARTARDVLAQVGHEVKPVDTAQGFIRNTSWLTHIEKEEEGRDRWSRCLGPGYRPAIEFWYRQSPVFLVPSNEFGMVYSGDPPNQVRGMSRVWLDPDGRLMRLEIRPEVAAADAAAPAEPDWGVPFGLAGLELAAFAAETQSTFVPPMYCDTRMTWNGPHPEPPHLPMRIEGGATDGRVVYFRVRYGKTADDTFEAAPPLAALRVLQLLGLGCNGLIMVFLFGGPLVLAFRNLRMGRADRRGAFRLAVFIAGIVLVRWVFRASHVSTQAEIGLFQTAMFSAAGKGVLIWVCYVAIEPFVRRVWPQTIISWSRLLQGRFRDPLVGRDILIGAVLGVLVVLALHLLRFLPLWPLPGTPRPMEITLRSLESPRFIVSGILSGLATAVVLIMVLLALVFVLRLILRLRWLAGAAFFLVMTLIVMGLAIQPSTNANVPALALGAVTALAIVLLFMRSGMLMLMSAMFVLFVLVTFPVSLDLSTWYAGASIAGMTAVIAVAGYGLWVSLAGRSLFRDELST